ncbi:MAG: oligosaccharide flippase family protein [Halopseudomonas sp.]
MKAPSVTPGMLALFRNRTWRSIAVLLAGAAAGQLITLLSAPLLTRIFSPEVFGQAGTVLAIASIGMPVAGLCYPLAMVLATNDREALALGRLSLAIGVLLSVLAALGIGLLYPSGEGSWGVSRGLLMLVPLLMCLAVVAGVLEQWANRRSLFAISARVSFAKSVAGNGGKVLGGLLAPLSMTLVLMSLVAEAVAAVLFAGWLKGTAALQGQGQPVRWWPLMVKYRQFPLFRAPQVLISCLSLAVPVLLLGTWYGPAAVGFFVLARSVIAAPSLLIGKAVGDVFYPLLARADQDKLPLLPFQLKAVSLLALAGAVPLLIALSAAPELFAVLFGDGWQMAGDHARWMALWFYFTLVGVPCVNLLPILHAQRSHLIFTCFSAAARGLLMYWACAVADLGAATSVALYCISGAVLNALLMLWVLWLAARRDKLLR